MAVEKPARATKMTKNTIMVPRPRRMPRLAIRLTAGSMAKDRNSETTSMMIRDRRDRRAPIP